MRGPQWAPEPRPSRVRPGLAWLGIIVLVGLAGQADVDAADGVPRDPERSCMTRPHPRIRVFMIHRRGSSRPAYIRTVGMQRYVETVMASGAWPGHKPMESLRVGAIAIRQYAVWHICHHQRGYRWRGRAYDIRQGDQLFLPDRAHRINRRIERAVDATWHVWLRKNGRYFRPGWRGYSGRDGWHLHEDTVTRLAKRGWGYQRILHQQLDPVRIVVVR
jgi:hypothetical protein